MNDMDDENGAPLPADEHARLKRMATNASVAVGATLATAKLGAWLLTDSVTILSSLLDSIVDVIASLVLFWTVRHALRPPDRSHRYGHGKAEPLGALAQAAFIGGSGIVLIVQAAGRFFNPVPLTATGIGIGVMVCSIVMTFGLVMFQRYVIRRTDSLAIGADQLHYAGDLLVNLAVIATLLAYQATGAAWLDSLAAAGIAGYLLFNAAMIGRGSFDVLMDKELSREDRKRIREIVTGVEGAEGLHDLRTRSSGTVPFIELHLEVDGALTVQAAHDIADAVEDSLREVYPSAEIILHQEPAGLDDHRLDRVIAKGRD